MKIRHKIEENEAEFALGLVLFDPILFSKFFQKSDLSMELTIPQKVMFCDNSRRVLLCTSRNVGKTINLIGRILRLIATYQPKSENSREEVLVFTPAEAHLTPLIDRLFAMITKQPFFNALILNWNKGDKPKIVTKTGLTIQARIEGSSGTDTNMVGLHPIIIIGDECEFGNQVCHRSRMGGAMPETRWIYAGVPNGVRGTPFYLLDQTKEGRSWSRHKCSMLTANPRFLRSKKYRAEMTDAFGGKTSPDYITQVRGEWGDEAMSSFPPGSVSWNNDLPYYVCRATGSDVTNAVNSQTIPSLLRIPQVQCMMACIGLDYGFSPDPATFVIGVKYAEDEPWKTYARISLYQTGLPKQLDILRYLWVYVLNNRGVMISVDSPEMYQTMLDGENKFHYDGRVKLTNQGGTVEMDTITGKLVTDALLTDPEYQQHRKDGKVIKVRRKYFLTEMFRRYMSNDILNAQADVRLAMAYDAELESELVSTIERRLDSGYTVYDVPKSKGVSKITMDQITDACRALVDCIIEVETRKMGESFDYDGMVSALGWAGKVKQDDPWKAPWGD